MKISGHEEKCVRLINEIRALCQRNYYFANLWGMVVKSNLEVTVLGETELLKDPQNPEKSLTNFSGYCLNGVIRLFETRYDVDDSFLSRFLHELCHALLRANPGSLAVIDVMNMSFYATIGDTFDISQSAPSNFDVEKTSKLPEVHDLVPEEELANRFSELLIGKRYDREWKTQHIKEVDNLVIEKSHS